MYTKEQVDAMLSQVEQEFEKTLGSIAKNENIEEELNNEEAVAEVETEEVMAKSEDEAVAEVETESEESFETIEELYDSMNKSEKEAHYAACKKSLFGEEESSETEEPVVEAKEEVMAKSESDKLKEENEELKKSYNQLNELVSKMFSVKKAPAQKAITGTDYIAKSEEVEGEEAIDLSKMSKGEITEKLKTVDQSNLTKSDRNAINDFYLKNGSVDKIKHLIIE